MKKLIALIGAVATAFGLYAADSHYYATSFEAGVDTGCTTEPLAFNLSEAGWTAGTTTETSLDLGTYKPGEGYAYPTEGKGLRRWELFEGKKNNANYLKLETGSSSVGKTIGEGEVFIDQTVKFTGFEEVPAADAIDGQIAIWASAIEADDTVEPAIVGETNLYARVGTGTGIKDVKIAIDDFDLAKWYRLTIKSIGNVIKAGALSQAGFLVYVDGEPAAIVSDDRAYSDISTQFNDTATRYYTNGQLFTGIKTDSAAFTTVAFQGIGSIDDFVTSVEAPDFAAEVGFTVAAITGATIDKVVRMDGETEVELTAPYAVMPGTTVKVYFKAADGYRLEPAVATIVINEAGQINVSDQITVVEGYATLNGVIKGEAELAAMMAGLKDGDEVAFIKDGAVTNSEETTFYTFTTNTQIAVANGAWTLTIGNVDDEGNSGTFGIYTEIANDITVEFAAGDTLSLGDGITIAAGKTLDASDEKGLCVAEGGITVAGTLKGVNAEVFSAGTITLDGAGSVWSATQLACAGEESIFTNGEVVEAGNAESGYTYSLNATPTPTETGFMVIIAGQTEGHVYETLAAAVEAAQDGSTIKLLSDETVVGKCDITKNITLDLNGKTLARDNNAATLFVIKDATLTINGATAGSALVGRLNVGDSVYNGGVRTAHWDGALVINGGTYSVGNGQTVIHVNGDCLDAAVTINNATLTSPTDNGVQFNGKGTFAINNSTINGATAVYMKAGTLTIDKDSKINATAETWTAPVANHNGSNPTGDAIVMDSTTGYQGAISLTVAEGAQVTKVAKDAATIRETITDATGSTTVKIDAPTIGGIALTEAFLAKVANGSAQLPGYVATIGTVPYPTIAAAVAAAQNDDTIKVIADCTVADAILVDKAVTLDATGKTVTCAAMYPFFVKGGDLTITDGTFTQNVVDGIILWAKDGGKITVNGGDFSAIPDGEIAYVSTADALIKIYGGKFVMADKADGSKGDVLNVAQTLGLNKTDYIQVYGGSFSKDPDEGDDALGPTFVADGYASVKQDNGLWKVGAAIIATFKVDDAIVKAETNIVAFTPVAPTNPSKEGYTFTGWTPAVDEISKSTVFVAQFKAEETKVDPEQPIPVPAEKTPEQVAEQMNTKGIANYLKVPTVVTDAAAYTAMFAAKADGNTVIIALKPTVEAEIKAELANTATSGSMLNPDATTSEVTITARPGLFYGIKAVGDVTTIGTANGQNWVQASGATVNVVRPTVSGNAAFFQAVCSPKAPPANN